MLVDFVPALSRLWD